MTTPNIATIDLGRFGVFILGGTYAGGARPEQAQEIERLGYGTLWVSGWPPAELSFTEPLLESTAALKVATGVVNVWTADAKAVAESFHRINSRLRHPRRHCQAPGRASAGRPANHVVIQVLGGDPVGPDPLLPTLAELAGPLGLDHPEAGGDLRCESFLPPTITR